MRADEAAGADVRYAPGPCTLAEARQHSASVKRPFNILTGWLERDIPAAELAAAFAWMRDMMGIGETRQLYTGGQA